MVLAIFMYLYLININILNEIIQNFKIDINMCLYLKKYE